MSLKILLAEDLDGKRVAIKKAIAKACIDAIEVVEVTSAFQALQRMSSERFDLLILDIALPLREEGSPVDNAGVDILHQLRRDPEQYQLPTHILGITAFPNLFESVTPLFASWALTLVFYDPRSANWEQALLARLEHIRRSQEGPANPGYEASLGIVCALNTTELTSVLALPWGWRQVTLRNDHTIYWVGEVETRMGPQKVCLAAAGRMGMAMTTILAAKMTVAFRPRYLVMTGIAAGVRGKVNLGDVVVASPCWDWGSGKWTHKAGQLWFSPAPHQIALDATIREKMSMLARTPSMLGNIREAWPGAKPDTVLRLRVGAMASGASVLADGRTIQRILDENRELTAVEMEAYGFLVAASEAPEPRPIAFVVKSIVDFGDPDKDDDFQAYGAYTSARVLQTFFEEFVWA